MIFRLISFVSFGADDHDTKIINSQKIIIIFASHQDKLLSVDECVLLTWRLKHSCKERCSMESCLWCIHQKEEMTRWDPEEKYFSILWGTRRRTNADSDLDTATSTRSQTRLLSPSGRRDVEHGKFRQDPEKRKSLIHFDCDRGRTTTRWKSFHKNELTWEASRPRITDNAWNVVQERMTGRILNIFPVLRFVMSYLFFQSVLSFSVHDVDIMMPTITRNPAQIDIFPAHRIKRRCPPM